MNRILKKVAIYSVAALLTVSQALALEIGKAAPDFSAQDTHGKAVKLSDFKGKIVVLEWTNHQCPFVRKFYDAGKMQELQKNATDDGVIWLSIVSSAEGKEGYTSAEDANKIVADEHAFPTAKILDPKADIAKLYKAATTPHMFVIDKQGNLVYMGAIDSINSPYPSDIPKADNYVVKALDALKAGKTPEITTTKSYGCGVKYAS
ncbi:MAG: redoxin domain-containing protein [Alphaproteobacteria bacterium]